MFLEKIGQGSSGGQFQNGNGSIGGANIALSDQGSVLLGDGGVVNRSHNGGGIFLTDRSGAIGCLSQEGGNSNSSGGIGARAGGAGGVYCDGGIVFIESKGSGSVGHRKGHGTVLGKGQGSNLARAA